MTDLSKPIWLDTARKEDGVKEPNTVKYFKATDYEDPDGWTAYCAAFVNWCLEQNAIKGTRSAAAISFKHFGKDVSATKPVGAIVVFEWSTGQHHVTFYAGGSRAMDLPGTARFIGAGPPPLPGSKGYLGGNQTREHEVCEESLPLSRAIAWRWPA